MAKFMAKKVNLALPESLPKREDYRVDFGHSSDEQKVPADNYGGRDGGQG